MAGGSGKSAITGMRFSKIAVFADLDNCRHSKTARRLPGGLGSGMKFARGTPEFNANMDAYFEMDECVPMTRNERILLRYWVRDSYDIETSSSGTSVQTQCDIYNSIEYVLNSVSR